MVFYKTIKNEMFNNYLPYTQNPHQKKNYLKTIQNTVANKFYNALTGLLLQVKYNIRIREQTSENLGILESNRK